jgi:hypothetical protein
MQSSHPSLLKERRRDIRRRPRLDAFVRPWGYPVGEREYAIVEDASEGGLCLRSATPLRKDDMLALNVAGQPEALKARVVWARRQGLIDLDLSHRIDPAWLAGCEVEAPSRARLKPLLKSRGTPPLVEVDTLLMRGLLAAGIIGVGALVVYGFVMLARMMGETATLWTMGH